MEEISGRADGADETRIDEFTTEVAQEEICDGADCADGFTTVAQEEISGADKTLRVDDFTTVAQEEISGRADGADGSTTEVAQEVSGRAEGADETRMDEFTTVAQPQIAVAPAVAKMIAPIIWACAIAKLMAQPAQQMMAKLMAEMAQQKMAKLMAEMAEMANLILGWENSKVLTELEDRTLRQTAPALSVTWTMHVASVSRLAVAFTVGNLFQREERAESSKEKSGPKKCERCDISFASPMSCVNVND
ncbi:unnamed protein product [Cladocopium goreaui]|uniref:Uncharacterized protein n=1 Tax=Cladocopium goreaui TaxID=2562237 RepID=A0A9P1BFE6_9DINO|nr:unnamed protein product [Cladocopium goreaui]